LILLKLIVLRSNATLACQYLLLSNFFCPFLGSPGVVRHQLHFVFIPAEFGFPEIENIALSVGVISHLRISKESLVVAHAYRANTASKQWLNNFGQ